MFLVLLENLGLKNDIELEKLDVIECRTLEVM